MVVFKTFNCFILKHLLTSIRRFKKTDMTSKLTANQLGERITQLRKLKGYSQEELATLIQISRSSLVQIELGNRGLDILELQQISLVLQFSVDEFISENFSVNNLQEEPITTESQNQVERVSVPRLQLKKFKNVLLYILERCAGKPNVGETVLYKLLYFSDFNYYELYEEQLTGATYRKLPYGPVPKNLDPILGQMLESGQLQRIKTEYHGYPQSRYLPLEKADLRELKASEKEVIDRVIDQMSDWSAAMLSSYSHGDKPWKATKDGDEINYELVFYRRPPYSVRVYEEEQPDGI
jgi:transcriptional regulator with XRE-family HTH domain